MSRSEELWKIIKEKISQEELLPVSELSKLETRILSNRVTADDWNSAILNSKHKDEKENGQSR